MAKIIKISDYEINLNILRPRTRDYNLGDGFILETVDKDDMYESWIYHKDYGIKRSIFGLSMKDCSYSEFLEMAITDIDTHIDRYIEDFAPELEYEAFE